LLDGNFQDLCNLLNALGAKIDDIGSNTLRITGVSGLHGGEYTIGADYLEVVSFAGAAAITRGEVTIRNAAVRHLAMISQAFRRLGISWQVEGEDLKVGSEQSLAIVPDLDGRRVPEYPPAG